MASNVCYMKIRINSKYFCVIKKFKLDSLNTNKYHLPAFASNNYCPSMHIYSMIINVTSTVILLLCISDKNSKVWGHGADNSVRVGNMERGSRWWTHTVYRYQLSGMDGIMGHTYALLRRKLKMIQLKS